MRLRWDDPNKPRAEARGHRVVAASGYHAARTGIHTRLAWQALSMTPVVRLSAAMGHRNDHDGIGPVDSVDEVERVTANDDESMPIVAGGMSTGLGGDRSDRRRDGRFESKCCGDASFCVPPQGRDILVVGRLQDQHVSHQGRPLDGHVPAPGATARRSSGRRRTRTISAVLP